MISGDTDDESLSRYRDKQFQKEMVALTAANDLVYGVGRRPPRATCVRGAYAENKRTGDFCRREWKDKHDKPPDN